MRFNTALKFEASCAEQYAGSAIRTINQRRAIHLSGQQAKLLSKIHAWLPVGAEAHTLWLSTHPTITQATPPNKAQTILGRSFSVVIFDAHSGFDVNALAAAVGTLRSGGYLILLTPNDWQQQPDPYWLRFTPYLFEHYCQSNRFIVRFRRVMQFYDLWQSELPQKCTLPTLETEFQWTVDQIQARQKLLQHRGVSLLLADRGRGKSTLLGSVAASLQQQAKNVLFTAPRRSALQALEQRLALEYPAYALSFHAPDEVLQHCPTADMLIVDEAAAIPIPMLLQMLAHYKHVIFSTTVQGYEGSGRGFLLKFREQLNTAAESWQQCWLYEPVRWQAGDALEGFIQQALLLPHDTVPDSLPESSSNSFVRSVIYRQIAQDMLLQDELLLRQIFDLLLSAHYQTRPSDLMQIMDGVNVSVHVLQQDNDVLAVALLSQEGGFDKAMELAVRQGKRRPQGHLLAQTLSFHVGIEQAACLRCERVMRIAVRPDVQGQGLGKQLLQHLIDYAEQAGRDYIGVSYAATASLRLFWQQAGFVLAREGYKRDKSSGLRSVVQVLGLSQAGLVLQVALHDLGTMSQGGVIVGESLS